MVMASLDKFPLRQSVRSDLRAERVVAQCFVAVQLLLPIQGFLRCALSYFADILLAEKGLRSCCTNVLNNPR